MSQVCTANNYNKLVKYLKLFRNSLQQIHGTEVRTNLLNPIVVDMFVVIGLMITSTICRQLQVSCIVHCWPDIRPNNGMLMHSNSTGII